MGIHRPGRNTIARNAGLAAKPISGWIVRFARRGLEGSFAACRVGSGGGSAKPLCESGKPPRQLPRP